MRTLVEQTASAAEAVREALGLAAEELPVHKLMGGEESRDDWRARPEQPQILVGTIDMLLSRALNRGYGESRFAWPVSFGLLNSDCRWIFDEIQLMGPGRTTSAQLDGLRAKLGTSLPCETIWASATVDREALLTIDRPELGAVLQLPAADRTGPLGARLTAAKRVERLDVAGLAGTQLARTIAEALLERHAPGSRTIAVLNTVRRAQDVHQALERAQQRRSLPARLVLLHSRFRPPERAEHLAAALGDDHPPGGTIVVATQVIEAGVDVSSALLATETAAWSAIVQRLGRCNRSGEHEETTALWLDYGQPTEQRAAPYQPEDAAAARDALHGLLGASASPDALARLTVAERRDEPAVLRRRDLLDLFDTAPDLSGLDVDVAPFVRERDERTVTVFFRPLGGGAPAHDAPRPGRDELVDVPVGEVRGRRAFVHDHVEGEWRRADAADLRTPVRRVRILTVTRSCVNRAAHARRRLLDSVTDPAPRCACPAGRSLCGHLSATRSTPRRRTMPDPDAEAQAPVAGRPVVLRGGTVLTMDAASAVLRDTDVLIVGDRIAAVGPQLAVPHDAEEIDARGGIVMPGMIDTHRHMWQTAMRGYGAD
jgi:CRISPR-associated endonuclease/helicase Cas3